ncbi:MAG: hypothetical protein KatS3mg013_0900 [Actinomycetota bacterium]|jgi:thiol-disulfide isomerase/thioredoxin|nr:MAG: hypothetical protein KatS3mg013_0900 [Actinomycetota bacterium]
MSRGVGARRAVAWGSVVLGALLTASLLARGGSSEVGYAGDLRVGGVLRELRLPTLEGDGIVDYAAYAERPLVINFFASWCPSCVAEMPDFETVHRRLRGRVAFLGISQSDARAASIDLVRRTGVTYDTAFDAQGAFFSALGGAGMPTTVFVRPGGEIADVWVGPLNDDALAALIAEHFGVTA